MSDFNFNQFVLAMWVYCENLSSIGCLVAEKSLCGWAQAEIWWVVAQQNRVTPSPFDFGLWTLDFGLGLWQLLSKVRNLFSYWKARSGGHWKLFEGRIILLREHQLLVVIIQSLLQWFSWNENQVFPPHFYFILILGSRWNTNISSMTNCVLSGDHTKHL